jgi:site-specific DNA recombinase
MKQIRCAIYTRKSSEEGLEQDFNSLHAQREACAAYVLSQASEGWNLLPDEYDDGGLSGGSLVRPALQRLLADIAAGKIDIIVVYKVDRLTRSLLDFAKLVEAFDKSGTSFVSITQSFNTTTSMGRLTLNMLLSFAQFEREVTAERIRDKIAASKAKGMWMGGTPPLGYKPNGRSLTIIEDHADIVRDIFQRYLEIGNVRLVAEQLEADGINTPRRTASTGRDFGDCRFSRGQIYKILSNPIYVGDIPHQGKLYAGQHTAIIDRDTYAQVKQLLDDHLQGERRAVRAVSPSLLAGLIIDEAGKPLVATHACKGKVRYRYYVSRALQHAPGSNPDGQRIPARELEGAVIVCIAEALDDPINLLGALGITLDPSELRTGTSHASQLAEIVRGKDPLAIRAIVGKVQVLDREIRIELLAQKLTQRLGLGHITPDQQTIELVATMRLTRTGMAMRLVQPNGKGGAPRSPDPALIRLLLKARTWWARLSNGTIDVATLARKEGVNDSWVTRVVRLNFLAPSIVNLILDGDQSVRLSPRSIVGTSGMPIIWAEQVELLSSI